MRRWSESSEDLDGPRLISKQLILNTNLAFSLPRETMWNEHQSPESL